MKISKILWTLLLVLLALCAITAAGCGDDDDDDDDDDSSSDDDDDDATDDDDDDPEATAEQFCQMVADCEEADAYLIPGACEASAELMEQETLNCALEEACGDFVGCVEDTDDGWLLDPMTMTATVLVASTEFGGWNLIGNKPVTTWESVAFLYEYNDVNETGDQNDCDIRGGKIYVSLDGAEFEFESAISPSVSCRSINNYLSGPQYDGADLGEGDHELRVVVADADGQQSNVFTRNFKVQDYAGGTGTAVTEIADDSFMLQGIHVPGVKVETLQDFYFKDQLEGKIVLFNVVAEWCIYCADEADVLEELYALYQDKADGPEVEIVLLMNQDDQGADPKLEDLVSWADRADPAMDLTMPMLLDPQSAFAGPYYIGNGVPYNFIVDVDGIIRFKQHGYGTGMVGDFSDIFDALIEEASAK